MGIHQLGCRQRKLSIGVFPVRRNILSLEEALLQKSLYMPVIHTVLPDIIKIVDIDDVCEHGIACDTVYTEAVIEKFRSEKVDALFIPFCDFGCERAAAEVAAAVQVPTLIWGARDEMPNTDFSRGRDTQCGMFAATKVLSRYGIKYSYILQCAPEDPTLQKGLITFLQVVSVLKSLKSLKILKIGSRPDAFVSVATDEALLMTKFGIECVPVSPLAINAVAEQILESPDDAFESGMSEWLSRIDGSAMEMRTLRKLHALKISLADYMTKCGCQAGAIECWPAMRETVGGFSICPCLGELSDMGLPIACETDINGAITMIMLEACNFRQEPSFLADLTMRHPNNDNAELLWHCGPFPYSLRHPNSRPYLAKAKERWELRPGNLTLLRLDELNGQYSLFCGEGHTTVGPETTGTYVWLEVEDWQKWEEALMFGPYIHHIGGIYGNYIPVFREVARYLDISFDTVDSNNTKSL